ncbi:trace amine-associated receptor 13c-like [Hoplias malabaricus]|uniref:trace amine-associated receptor 13c-like n=1 Tax=Hoplias malabaricus TaxID=27720 RepID=UPI00346244D4
MDDIVNENITVQYCFPDNNSSCRKEVRTGPAYIFLFIVLSCLSVCTVFLNLLVIISISHFKQLHTPTNLLILSLAVADLIVGLIIMPENIMQLIDSCWYLGSLACSVFPLVSSLSVFSSVFSLVLIAVDRYIAVCDPLLYPSRVTVYKMSICIILGWSLCLIYYITFMYFNDHLTAAQFYSTCYGECVLGIKYSWMIFDFLLSFVTPCSVILVLYALIFKVARHQAKAISALSNGVPNKQESKVSGSSQAKAAKKLSFVISVYLICYIPFYLTSFSVENVTTSSMVWTVFGWLMFFNSSMNPIIYAIFYQWFRVSIKHIMTCRIFESSSSRFSMFSDHV